jgi:hypothetical protein
MEVPQYEACTLLYIKTRNNNDPTLKEHYKVYCKILSKVISAANKLYLNKIIETSNNKTKATWEVIRNTTRNSHVSTNVTCLNTNGNNIQNHQDIRI